MCRFIGERGTKETDGISVMTEGTAQTRLSLGRDGEGGRLGHWLMPLMLAPWPFLRAFLFSWRRFLTLLLCHVHQLLVPRARGTRTPSGQTGTYLGSSLWTLPPPCRLGLPEHGPPGHLQEPGWGSPTVVRRGVGRSDPAPRLAYPLAASLLQDMLAGSRPDPACPARGRLASPRPADACWGCPHATGQLW